MKVRLLLLGVAFLLLSPVYVFAADQQEVKETVEQAPTESAKFCPVCGPEEKMEGEGISYEHEGKMFWFCSQECLDQFKKDPKKYQKVAGEEGGAGSEKHEDHDHKDHAHEGSDKHNHAEDK